MQREDPMKSRSLFAILCLIILVVTQSGCSRSTPQLKNKDPHIRGEIIFVTLRDENRTVAINVQGVLESDTLYDRASIKVSEETKVFIEEEGNYKIASITDLAVGQSVEVLFTGLIAMSDPVQAEAEEVLIRKTSTK